MKILSKNTSKNQKTATQQKLPTSGFVSIVCGLKVNKRYKKLRLSHQLIELDSILQHFYAEVKKQNGDDYEPIIHYAVCRQGLTDTKAQKYKHSIIRDDESASSRSVLEGKARPRVLRENVQTKLLV